MSDIRLREAERRWLETRWPDDERAWLRECVRAGSLSEQRLGLLEQMGHFDATTSQHELEFIRTPLAESIVWASECSSELGRTQLGRFWSEHDVGRVSTAVEERRQLLVKGGWILSPPRAQRQAGGRLLLMWPDETLWDGASMAASQGLFDEYDWPAPDLWVTLLSDSHIPRRARGPCLVAWIPPDFIQLADIGIRVNCTDCIGWADTVENSTVALKLRELFRE